MRRFLERLVAGEVLVGDGAWGTLLMARGLPAGLPPEMFNLSRPEVSEDIARLYLEAGADLITTNTFGGSPVRLRLHGLEAKVDALNQSAVEAARRAVGSRAYVSGSIGPSGWLLKPYGDLASGELAESFAVQARAPGEDTLGRVVALTVHPAFDPRNPNRLRALGSQFAHFNPARFHDLAPALVSHLPELKTTRRDSAPLGSPMLSRRCENREVAALLVQPGLSPRKGEWCKATSSPAPFKTIRLSSISPPASCHSVSRCSSR